jgi:uncharacterized protein (AIM24 family)
VENPSADAETCERARHPCRFCAGESLFRLHYKNSTQVPQSMSLTPIFPAKVIPVDLARYNGLTIQKMSYFATTGNDLKFSTFMPSTIGNCIGGILLQFFRKTWAISP